MKVDATQKEHIVFVVYDGIANSVFASQVVTPLLSKITDGTYEQVTLLSFERSFPSTKVLSEKIPAHDQFDVVIGRKLPFWGITSLYFACYQLTRLLKFTPCTKIIARGPLAGFVAQRVVSKNRWLRRRNIEVVVQARGLCAEEFRYSWQQESPHSFFEEFIYKLKRRNFYAIEKRVFGMAAKKHVNTVIEAVSPALKDYVVAQFGAHVSSVTLAHHDIPKVFPADDIAKWRYEVREELGIALDRVVYCYSGSYKPWQCAPETIDYFMLQHAQEPKSFLLVLTLDVEAFEKHLVRVGVSAEHYKVKAVSAAALFRYLSAGDFGMLFRKPDVVNWVSRPTKMLEYQSVGLKILHNNTIAWLK